MITKKPEGKRLYMYVMYVYITFFSPKTLNRGFFTLAVLNLLAAARLRKSFFPLQCSTALTTCRDGWLGFLFRWRTQQSAITGINCRITQLPNLWTQKALGRTRSNGRSRACRISVSIHNTSFQSLLCEKSRKEMKQSLSILWACSSLR